MKTKVILIAAILLTAALVTPIILSEAQVALTIAITSSTASSGSTTSSTTLSYTATFNEPVADFVLADITVTGTANGGLPVASNFAGSGTTYTFDVVRGSSDGTAIVSIDSAKATDAATNPNTASNTYTLTIDTIAPPGIIQQLTQWINALIVRVTHLENTFETLKQENKQLENRILQLEMLLNNGNGNGNDDDD